MFLGKFVERRLFPQPVLLNAPEVGKAKVQFGNRTRPSDIRSGDREKAVVGFVWGAFPREAFGVVEDPAPQNNIPELIPAWTMEQGVTAVSA